MSVSVLDREMFSEAEAARLLRLSQSTLHYWLEGGERRGKTYLPVVRAAPRGGRAAVTWAEFLEAGLFRKYRTHRVPMAELRTFIEPARERTGAPYPLAHHRPFVGEGRALLADAQDRAGLDAEFCLVAVVRDQLVLTPASQQFFDRVTWEDDIAVGWRPHDDSRSPVRMDPDHRFGRPAIKGISTEVLWKHADAGEAPEETAKAFDLDVDNVHWALAYETSSRAA